MQICAYEGGMYERTEKNRGIFRRRRGYEREKNTKKKKGIAQKKFGKSVAIIEEVWYNIL